LNRLAPVAFDAAVNELTRYHRFLLLVNATRTPDGKPFNYAAVPGEAWSAPHSEWIRQYRACLNAPRAALVMTPIFGKARVYPIEPPAAQE